MGGEVSMSMGNEWRRKHPRFWDSRLRERIGTERHLAETWDWLLYNEGAPTIGVYRPNLRRMSADTWTDGPSASAAEIARLAELSPESIRWDARSGYVWIVNAVMYQHDADVKDRDLRLKSESLELELAVAAKSPFWGEFLVKYKSHAIGRIATGDLGRDKTKGARVALLPDEFQRPSQKQNRQNKDQATKPSIAESEAPSKPLRSPFEAPSKPFTSPSEAPSKPLRSPIEAPPLHTITDPITIPTSVAAPALARDPAHAHARTHARAHDPDGSERFAEVPHILDSKPREPSAFHEGEPRQPEPAPFPDAHRAHFENRLGPAAPEVGAPTVQDSRKVGSVLAGMGLGRHRGPLTTLAEWRTLALDAKARFLAYPLDGAEDLRAFVAPLRDATDAVVAHYAAKVRDDGAEPDGEVYDAVNRAVALRSEWESPEATRDVLVRVVDWAAANPDDVGKPYKGRPVWRTSIALFGAAEGGKWVATSLRLPENVNAMLAAEKRLTQRAERREAEAEAAEPDSSTLHPAATAQFVAAWKALRACLWPMKHRRFDSDAHPWWRVSGMPDGAVWATAPFDGTWHLGGDPLWVELVEAAFADVGPMDEGSEMASAEIH